MPTTLLLAPPDFQTFLRPCILYTSYDDAEERWPLSFISSMI